LIGVTGLRHPSESRFLRDPRFAFPVRLNPGESDRIYFRVDTRFSFAATADLVHDSGILRKVVEFNVIWLIYLSMLLVLFLYNLFIYMNARDPLYLYYIFFLAIYGFYQFFVMGYAHNFLTDNYYLITVLINSLSQLSLFLHSGYVLRLLEVKDYSPRLDRFIRGFRPLLVLGAVATVIGFETVGTKFNIVTNTVILITFYLAALGALRRNVLISMVFLAGWLSFVSGLLVYLFLIAGVIPFEESSIRFIHAGNIGEIVAMSFALSLRLRSIAVDRAAPEKGGSAVENRAAQSEDEPPERRSHLKENDVSQIEGALHRLIEGERIYLKEDLKLSLMSELCGFSVHQISEYLNRHLGVNFNDYINERRVRHARELIEKNPSLSLLRIAFDSGFQSKSTFNLAFSRFAGLSPSDFRKKSQKNGPEL
jgi:AraC-like DNA-binding protein